MQKIRSDVTENSEGLLDAAVEAWVRLVLGHIASTNTFGKKSSASMRVDRRGERNEVREEAIPS